jgi:hypothetical protein
MKTTQSIMLLATLLAANYVQAQEPAAAPQQNLTFPTQAVASAPVYYQPAVASPYTAYQNYAAPSYYYPYPQQQQAYQQAYRPYYYPTQQYYPAQPAYNPYMAQQQQIQQQQQPRMMPGPARQAAPAPQKKVTHAWGDTRYLWPDYYTDFTGDVWDKMINAPYDMGRMPGGWQFPSISTPDPVTVSDAIANQVPPFAEEAAKMVPADDVGKMRPF